MSHPGVHGFSHEPFFQEPVMTRKKPADLTPFKTPAKLAAALERLTSHWSGSEDELLDAQLRLIERRLAKGSLSGGTCDICGIKLRFSRRHDDRYCPSCNRWKRITCRRKSCRWCSGRPPTPHPKPTAQPPADYGVYGLPKPMEQAIVARCHRILALPLNAEGEAGEWAIQLGHQLLVTPVYSLTSKAVRRWVVKVFNCLNGEIPKLGPPVVLHGLYHNDWTAKERAWVETIPVVGTPSIPVLRQTIALAELKVLDLDPCEHGVRDETGSRGSGLRVSLRPNQGNLTEHEVRLKMFHSLRLAGFDVSAFVDVEISRMKRSWIVVVGRGEQATEEVDHPF